MPVSYRWPQGKRAAFVFSMDVDADSPWLWINRGKADPRYLSHLEQRRYGLREGIWRILDLLDRYGVKGSFYVPGSVAEGAPQLLETLIGRGHEVGLHGYYHEFVTEVSDAEFTEALERSIALFRAQTGQAPRGFRSPAWEMTGHMLAEVKRLGLYDSSLSGHDHPYEVGGVVEVPVQWTIDDAIYWKFLGGGGDLGPPVAPGQVLDIWREEWLGLHELGGMMMLTVHDYISSRAHRLRVLDRLLATVADSAGTWIATSAELADWHANSANAGQYSYDAAVPRGIHAAT